MKAFLSSLLRATYGIRLKWEEHTDGKVFWGEGCLSGRNDGLPLYRKGVILSLDFSSDFGWGKWVDWVHHMMKARGEAVTSLADVGKGGQAEGI